VYVGSGSVDTASSTVVVLAGEAVTTVPVDVEAVVNDVEDVDTASVVDCDPDEQPVATIKVARTAAGRMTHVRIGQVWPTSQADQGFGSGRGIRQLRRLIWSMVGGGRALSPTWSAKSSTRNHSPCRAPQPCAAARRRRPHHDDPPPQTDQTGTAELTASPTVPTTTCTVRAHQASDEVRSEQPGPWMIRVRRRDNLDPELLAVDGAAINTILQHLCRTAGYFARSLRSGFVTEAARLPSTRHDPNRPAITPR
jgi:hypothetical protein